jgi:serralysin
MSLTEGKLGIGALTLFLFVLSAPPARAASHQWRFNELFTNADGTVQFIEMQECCGSTEEWFLQSKWILAVHASHKYTFRSNLTGNTSNKYFLLGTQGFADTPGAPAPDAIIPNGFLPVNGDTLEYWQYPDATRNYGALPQDGVTALEVGPGPDGISGTDDDINAPAVNSPTNYSGQSGTIDLTVPVHPITWGAIKARAMRFR